MASGERCAWPGCGNAGDWVRYLGKPICERCWRERVCRDGVSREAVQQALRIRAGRPNHHPNHSDPAVRR